MHNYKKGDPVVWTRPSNGARERARVIDVGLDSSTVCIEVEGDRPYWVLTQHVEPDEPVRCSYTSPVLTGPQVRELRDLLNVALDSAPYLTDGPLCRVRITETPAGTSVTVLPAEDPK